MQEWCTVVDYSCQVSCNWGELCDYFCSDDLEEVEYAILKEWLDFMVASQNIKVDLFGMSHHRLKHPILHSLWELRRGKGSVRLSLPKTWTDLDETWNICEGPWCALTQKMGEIAPGFHLRLPKWFVFFCHTTNMAFRPLVLHQFWPFLKQKT